MSDEDYERWSETEIREAVDRMVREDDYSPEDAQDRIVALLHGAPEPLTGPGVRRGSSG